MALKDGRVFESCVNERSHVKVGTQSNDCGVAQKPMLPEHWHMYSPIPSGGQEACLLHLARDDGSLPSWSPRLRTRCNVSHLVRCWTEGTQFRSPVYVLLKSWVCLPSFLAQKAIGCPSSLSKTWETRLGHHCRFFKRLLRCLFLRMSRTKSPLSSLSSRAQRCDPERLRSRLQPWPL